MRLQEFLQGHGGSFSSKRLFVILCAVLMFVLAIVDTFFGIHVKEFIFTTIAYAAIGGLGGIAVENLQVGSIGSFLANRMAGDDPMNPVPNNNNNQTLIGREE
jgi:hypothetical protein